MTGALRSTDPFWHQPGGLDLVMAHALPGGRFVEVRLRGGQVYRIEACEPAFAADRTARSSRLSTVGGRVRALRLEAGRPAREIAAAAGMAPSNYSRLEASRVDPRIDTLRRIAGALEVPLEALVESTQGAD